MSEPCVLIATPAYGGAVYVPYMNSLFHTLEAFKVAGIKFEIFMPEHESLITRARNAACAHFLGNKRFTHLLFIDADIGFPYAAVIELIRSGYGICGCPYPIKVLGGDGKLERYCLDLFDTSSEKPTVAKTPTYDSSKRFFKVKSMGTGFMMVRRSVLETFIASGLAKRFINDSAGYNSSTDVANSFYDFFDTLICPDNHRYLSEDYAFCWKARQLGFDIWLCPHYALTHSGGKKFEGDFLSTYTFL